MRCRAALTVLAVLAWAPAVEAQDPFAGVTNEPRPSEYLHWDADAFDDFERELQGRLEAGEGIWQTPFAFTAALARSEDRRHSISIVHRGPYTHPEIHETKWDIYVILSGSGSALMGGERVGWIEGRPPAEQSPRLEGATRFRVSEGDLLHVPARVWHQVLADEGETITYALINVFE